MLAIDPQHIRPNHVAAVIARLRSFPQLLALCPDDPPDPRGRVTWRIGNQATAFVKDGATRQIAVIDAPSPPPSLWVPRSEPRVDVHCYATQGHEARDLAYLVLAALCPDTQGRAFTEGRCRIIDVRPLTSAPIDRYDRELQQHRRIWQFALDKSEIPVGVGQ